MSDEAREALVRITRSDDPLDAVLAWEPYLTAKLESHEPLSEGIVLAIANDLSLLRRALQEREPVAWRVEIQAESAGTTTRYALAARIDKELEK